MILAENMIVKLVILPENHDPDSFLRALGPAEFQVFLKEKAIDFVLFKSRTLREETANDPVKKIRVLKDIVQTIAKVPDPLARSTYIKECSSILDVEERILIAETTLT